MTEQEIKIALQQGAIPIGMPKGYDFDQAVTQSAIDAAEDARRSQEAAEAAAGSANRSKNAAADSAANAAVSEASAATYEELTRGYAANVQTNVDAAAASAQAAAGSAQAAANSAQSASNAQGGAEHWAGLAYEYTEPLRRALNNMFEYDENADVQLVANPLEGSDPGWEVDENGDLMPVEV